MSRVYTQEEAREYRALLHLTDSHLSAWRLRLQFKDALQVAEFQKVIRDTLQKFQPEEEDENCRT